MLIEPNLEGVKSTLQEHPFPVDVIVEVTNYCNLRCIMCPYPILKRKKGEMSFSTYTRIIDEIAKENTSTRVWLAIMGEPLILGDRLIDMIKYAKDHGIEEINLNTNAVYLTAEMSEKLLMASIDKILISLDAFTRETYEKIRIGGDFHRVIYNTEHLINIIHKKNLDKPEVIIQFIVMEENQEETEFFKDYWLTKGAVVKIRPKLGWGNAVESSILNNAATGIERFPCAWLTRTVSVHWDGTFAQCDADHEGIYSPGNILSMTIKEIWTTEIAKRRARHWNKDFNFEPCKDCKDWLAGRSYFYYPPKIEKKGALND